MSGFLIAPKEYFQQIVKEGLESRRLAAPTHVEVYLVHLLEHYLDAKNLFAPKSDSGESEPETLAEMFLLAQQKTAAQKIELLRRTGDRALYVSGFFGESLNRKIVDIDYYAQIGGAAYASLVPYAKDDGSAEVYRTFARQFMDYADVLTVISHRSLVQSDQSVIRLYDRYLRTGSSLARERLVEMGLFHLAGDEGHHKLKKTGTGS